MIKVACTVDVYEDSGKRLPALNHEVVTVESHSTDSNWVRIKIGNADVTVNGADLMLAISNSMKVGTR